MDNLPTNVTSDAQAAQSNAPAQAATSEVQATESSPSSPSIDDLQRQIKELRAENAKHRKKAQEQEATAQREVEQRLKEQGEYKQLAEQHEARVRELEPVNERYTNLSAQISKQIASETKDWPRELKAFDPGEDAPIEDRLAWMEKSRPLLQKLQDQARSGMPGNSPNPKPAGTTPEAQQNHYRNKALNTGRYQI
jgi:DNA repair exonuclease SbcCD ATPase subunit